MEGEQEERTVLLHKRLSFSDLADTVLQTGRIVLPRNQMEVNADTIISIANSGARNVNPENGKATYELTVTDASGREWAMLLKQWTANSSQAPRPIYVLERTSACMKAHRAIAGHILQAYMLHSDPNTLRITVISPNTAASTGQRASAAAAREDQQTEAVAVGIELLSEVAAAAEAEASQQNDQKQRVNNLEQSPNPHPSIAAGNPSTTFSAGPPHLQPNPYINPTTNANAMPLVDYTAGYVLGVCKRSPDCYKEAGHPGFCSSGYRPITAANTTAAANKNKNDAANNSNVDYFGRCEDKRSPADALNAAALQMQQQQQQQGKRKTSPPPPPSSGAAGMMVPFTRMYKSSRVTYQSLVNVPQYSERCLTGGSGGAAAAAATAGATATAMDTINGLDNSGHPPPPFQTHNSPFSGFGGQLLSSPAHFPPQNQQIVTTKEICPTWIPLTCGALHGDLHIPSMLIALSNKLSSINNEPVSVNDFQLLAQGQINLDSTRHSGSGGGGRDADVIMVEGAGMSLQRWLKSWDLPFPGFETTQKKPSSSSLPHSDALEAKIDVGGSGGGLQLVQDALRAPHIRSRMVNKPHPSKTERLSKRKSALRRNNSNSAIAAALAATELAIAEAEHAAAVAVASVSAAPFNIVENDGSGSNEFDIEAGEALLSMMEVFGENKGGKEKRAEKKKPERQVPQQQQQQQVAESGSVLIEPQAVLITPYKAAALCTMLLNEKIERQNAAADAFARVPTTAAGTAMAMQMKLQHEATVRAHARLDQLSKRAKLAKILSCLAQIKIKIPQSLQQHHRK